MHNQNMTARRSQPGDDTAMPSVSHRQDDRSFASIPGELASIRIDSRQAGHRLSMMESVAAPGCATPLHSHTEDEVIYVISGNPTFQLGTAIHHLAPGGIVVIPAETPHAWINRTKADLRLLAIFSPGGIEALFPLLTGLSIDQIVPLAASYGTTVLGPPMSDTDLSQVGS